MGVGPCRDIRGILWWEGMGTCVDDGMIEEWYVRGWDWRILVFGDGGCQRMVVM